MIFKKTINLLFAVTLCSVSFGAVAETSESNSEKESQHSVIVYGNEGPHGGGGVVCRTPEGKVTTAEILDLWEAQAFKRMPINHAQASTEEQLKNALSTYEQYNGHKKPEIERTAWELYAQVELRREGDVPYGLIIAAPTDLLAPFLPSPLSGCSFEGIGAYIDNTQMFFVDLALYDVLSSTNKAALFFHEAIYKYLRDHYGVTNSISARNITACVFAQEPCEELSPISGLPKKGPMYKCVPNGWTKAYNFLPNFDVNDRRMGQPEFYIFPVTPNSQLDQKITRKSWRVQQTGVERQTTNWLDVQIENVLVKSFFDIKFITKDDIELDVDGRVVTRAVGENGNPDVMVSTYSSDGKNPWRRTLGPSFVYRLKPSAPEEFTRPYLEVNGFPLTCEKVR